MFMELTQHAGIDRADRIIKICQTIGMGEIVKVFPARNDYGPTEWCVTNTGILIVRIAGTNQMITAYALREWQLVKLYHSHGIERVPQRLISVVCNNEKKRKYLYKN